MFGTISFFVILIWLTWFFIDSQVEKHVHEGYWLTASMLHFLIGIILLVLYWEMLSVAAIRCPPFVRWHCWLNVRMIKMRLFAWLFVKGTCLSKIQWKWLDSWGRLVLEQGATVLEILADLFTDIPETVKRKIKSWWGRVCLEHATRATS